MGSGRERGRGRVGLGVAVVVTLGVIGGVGLGVVRFRAGQVRRWGAEAREALAAGRFAEADAGLRAWLNRRPTDPEALALRGRAALGMSQPTEAAGAWRQVVEAGRLGPDALLLRALLAVAAGRGGEVDAETTLAQAFDAPGPTDRQVVEALARLRMERFDLAGSLAVLNRWAGAFPSDPEPVLRRAEVLQRAGAEPDRLIPEYQEALRRAPDRTAPRLKLAGALLAQHRAAEALAEAEAILTRLPDDPAAHLAAARGLGELGDEAAADRHLSRALTLAPADPDVHRAAAEAAQRRGDWSAALAALDRAAELDPFDAETHQRRGMALVRLGRPDEARAERTRAAELRADLTRLNEARARLVAQPGDLAHRLEVARWMFSHGHDLDGVRWSEQILRDRPDEPGASRLLADYYRRRGDMGRANFHALHAAPDSPPTPDASGPAAR